MESKEEKKSARVAVRKARVARLPQVLLDLNGAYWAHHDHPVHQTVRLTLLGGEPIMGIAVEDRGVERPRKVYTKVRLSLDNMRDLIVGLTLRYNEIVDKANAEIAGVGMRKLETANVEEVKD